MASIDEATSSVETTGENKTEDELQDDDKAKDNKLYSTSSVQAEVTKPKETDKDKPSDSEPDSSSAIDKVANAPNRVDGDGKVEMLENDESSRDMDEGIDMEEKDDDDDDTEKSHRADLPANDDARNKMFNKGLMLDKDGKKDEALKCYLKCLVGLKENSRFALLPQCLRNIGDIYYGKDEYDKAISFIQAEKLYYESVLIDDTELQKHIDEVTASGIEEASTDANIDSLRATEYEQLARLCLDEKQPQLALEYAGKATKLRQNVYGEGHPVVQQTLDFFATVYAEVGKVQYTESMGVYDTGEAPDLSGDISPPVTPTTEPTSILRKRRPTDTDQTEKRVRFDDTHYSTDDHTDREERCARLVLLVLFVLLLMILLILGLYIYCSLNQTTACRNFKQLVIDVVMRLRYLYYHYTTSNKDAQFG